MQRRKLVAADVHGNGAVLTSLLSEANYRPGLDQLILLGDYINKGPDSHGTLQTVQELERQGAIVLRGNHEHRLLVTGPQTEEQQMLLRTWAPYLATMRLWYEDEDFIYVHAGIRPGIALASQSPKDLTNIRDAFHHHDTELRKSVVFGHTPTHRLGATPGTVWWQRGKIGIDTGAAQRIALSLVDLTNRIVYAEALR